MIIIEVDGVTFSKRNSVKEARCTGCAFIMMNRCGGTCHRSTMFPRAAIYKRHYTASEVANNQRIK